MAEGNHSSRKMASRLREIMGHTTRYCFDGRSRLVADTGVSRSEVTRILSGDCNPSYRVVCAVIEALERDLGIRIDSRDVLSFTGEFRNTVCDIVGCRGCPACRPQAGAARIPTRSGDSVPLGMPFNIPTTYQEERGA